MKLDSKTIDSLSELLSSNSLEEGTHAAIIDYWLDGDCGFPGVELDINSVEVEVLDPVSTTSFQTLLLHIELETGEKFTWDYTGGKVI